MHILIVYCHPSKTSYTHQILEQLKTELSKKNCSVEVSDLYAMNFQSDMTELEFAREGSSRFEMPIAEDVLKEHKKIQQADSIIYLYPVWWSDCPAKMKGWFDRVFTVGFAYKHAEHLPKMKTIKHGVALCTAGYTNEMLDELGIAQSMKNVMLDDRFGKRFENKEMVILGGTLNVDIVKQKHAEQTHALITRICL